MTTEQYCECINPSDFFNNVCGRCLWPIAPKEITDTSKPFPPRLWGAMLPEGAWAAMSDMKPPEHASVQFISCQEHESIVKDLEARLKGLETFPKDGDFSVDFHVYGQKEAEEAAAKIKDLEAQLERERMRLAACGVAAMQNTDKTKKDRIGADNEYYSASYGDVCAAVDREIDLREKSAKAKEALETIRNAMSEKGPRVIANEALEKINKPKGDV